MAKDGIIKNEWENPWPEVFIDTWSGYAGNTGKLQTSIFIEFSPTELQFVTSRKGYSAAYRIEVAIFDNDNQRVKTRSLSDNVQVSDYEDIAGNEQNRFFRFNFQLPGGQYRTEVMIEDANTHRRLIKGVEFQVDLQHPYTVDVSELMLGKHETVQLTGKKAFNSILPDARRVYGLNLETMFYYFEIYSQRPTGKDSVEYIISAVSAQLPAKEVARGVLALRRDRLPVMGRFDTADEAPGNYRLVLSLRPHGKDVFLERQKAYIVFQSPTDLRYREFADVLSEIRLIATAEEWDFLKSMQSGFYDQSAQQAAIDAFWEGRDPTPKTVRNEVMAEFYNRACTAKLLFREERRDRSGLGDRSKVFLLLGKPDAVNRQSDGTMVGNLEIWRYQYLNLNVIFQDYMGFGDFRLVTPDDLLGNLR